MTEYLAPNPELGTWLALYKHLLKGRMKEEMIDKWCSTELDYSLFCLKTEEQRRCSSKVASESVSVYTFPWLDSKILKSVSVFILST